MSLSEIQISQLREATTQALAMGKRLVFQTPDASAYLSARMEDGMLRLSSATVSSKGCAGDANALHKLEHWLTELGLEDDKEKCEQRSQSYRCMLDADKVKFVLDKAPWETLSQGDPTWPLGIPTLVMMPGGIDE